jgi:hypothetical protein
LTGGAAFVARRVSPSTQNFAISPQFVVQGARHARCSMEVVTLARKLRD